AVEGPAAVDGDVGPLLDPAALRQQAQPLAELALAMERCREGGAQRHQLPHGERAAIQGDQNLEIALGQAGGGDAWHTVAGQRTIGGVFPVPDSLAMSSEKQSFVNVDELLPQVSVEQAAAFYGVPLP